MTEERLRNREESAGRTCLGKRRRVSSFDSKDASISTVETDDLKAEGHKGAKSPLEQTQATNDVSSDIEPPTKRTRRLTEEPTALPPLSLGPTAAAAPTQKDLLQQLLIIHTLVQRNNFQTA